MLEIEKILKSLNSKMEPYVNGSYLGIEFVEVNNEYAVYQYGSKGNIIGRSMVHGSIEKVTAYLKELDALPVT